MLPLLVFSGARCTGCDLTQLNALSFQATQEVLDQAGLLKSRVGFADVVNNDFVPR